MFKVLANALLLALVLLQSCGTVSNSPSGQPVPTVNIAGKWEGISRADCTPFLPDPGRCGAVQDITFSLFQDGHKLEGVYSCAINTAPCRHLNRAGKVFRSEVHGPVGSIWVEFDDGSSCWFAGQFDSEKAQGRYSCYGGESTVERGYWRLNKAF